MDIPFFTIGHSNRTIETFVALLRGAEVTLVADIRKLPGSRAHPQFDGPALADALAPHQIGYEHIPALGGLRGRTPDVTPETNALWTNRSFHNYADYALTEPFRAGLAHLLERGHQHRCAIMCSEAVWWRCHRRIVADYLLASGEKVLHIMGEGRLEPARLTPGALVGPDHSVYYPPARGTPMEPPGTHDVVSRRSD